MTYLVLVIGLIIAGVGVFGIALPGRMAAMVALVRFTNGLRYLAASFRFALGVVLYLVADSTNFPVTMQILAAFTVLSGIVVLLLDRATLQRWLDGVSAWPPAALRGISTVALGLGAFFVAAVV